MKLKIYILTFFLIMFFSCTIEKNIQSPSDHKDLTKATSLVSKWLL